MRGMRTAGAGIVAAAVLATVLTGCSAGEADDRPSVYVTTNILGDVVAELAGDELEVVNLMAPGADPHSFELSAQQVAGMRDAELIVTNGLGLEEGLLQHVEAAAAEDVEVFAAGDHVDVLEYSDSGGPDPHFWTDPAQMLLVIDALAPELAELAAIPAQNRALVTNHHVFGYLARRHDVTLLGAAIPGGTTLAAPSTSDLQELVDAIDESGVSTIFAESSSPDQLVQVLADEADRDVAVVELLTESLAPAGEPGDSYLDMLRVNTERISEGLTP
jgi:zinc/manganese transport system substrate-binding protein